MKKFIAMLLATLSLTALASCDETHTHTWGDYVDENGKVFSTCTGCEEKKEAFQIDKDYEYIGCEIFVPETLTVEEAITTLPSRWQIITGLIGFNIVTMDDFKTVLKVCVDTGELRVTQQNGEKVVYVSNFLQKISVHNTDGGYQVKLLPNEGNAMTFSPSLTVNDDSIALTVEDNGIEANFLFSNETFQYVIDYLKGIKVVFNFQIK